MDEVYREKTIQQLEQKRIVGHRKQVVSGGQVKSLAAVCGHTTHCARRCS